MSEILQKLEEGRRKAHWYELVFYGLSAIVFLLSLGAWFVTKNLEVIYIPFMCSVFMFVSARQQGIISANQSIMIELYKEVYSDEFYHESVTK